MGYARGKVGSVVLARSKGQQITRAYNESPKNPRSEKQMLQRSVFMAATKFFSRGQQAFFKFAFENKSPKQSDYNAFMSENAKRGLHTSQAAFTEATYPSIAPFMMTKGSLAELPLLLNSGKTAFELEVNGLQTSASIGDLSQSLISTYGAQEGDIVTLCVIVANGSNADNTPSVEPDKRGQVKWTIKQFIVDTASFAAITDALGAIVTAGTGSLLVTPTQMSTSACAACITLSRDTQEGLKVGNTYLELNDIALTIYENGNDAEYIGKVLDSWKATGSAILQGSMTTGAPKIVSINNNATEIVESPQLFVAGDPVILYVTGENLSEATLANKRIKYTFKGAETYVQNPAFDEYTKGQKYTVELFDTTSADHAEPITIEYAGKTLTFVIEIEE